MITMTRKLVDKEAGGYYPPLRLFSNNLCPSGVAEGSTFPLP